MSDFSLTLVLKIKTSKIFHDYAIDVRQRLEPYYEILDFHMERAILYFRAQKQ